MGFHSPQGDSALGFKRPPLDGSVLLPEIFDNNAKENPTHPIFRYVEADGTLKTILWADAVPAFQRAAQIVRQQVAVPNPEMRPVVAILASLDHITYFSLFCGVLRAGYTVFPISPRNSKPAILHLLQSAGCSHLFVSPDSTTQELVEGAVAATMARGGSLKLIPTPSFDDLYTASTTPDFFPIPKPKKEDIALLLHSSGSVTFPKVVRISYHTMIVWARCIDYGEVDVGGQIWSAHTLPIFHLAGMTQIVWASISGVTLAVFPPVVPPVVPTAARVFEDAVATNARYLFCVPAFLEVWAREPTQLAELRKFRSVMFAGAPLQPAIGDLLSKNGVNLAHMYGLTEVGACNLFVPKHAPKEGWDYFYLTPQVDPLFVPVDDLPGVYRLIVKKCATHSPAVFNTTVDGVPAFDTNDLFVCHPTNEKLWKLYGRQDDQIIHSNGEKTNPTPLESIILRDSRIKHALMFGRGEFNAGVLIFPAEPISSADSERVVEFRRDIWPIVREANQFAPAHSRIFKEMILIADPSKQIDFTAKGNPRREATLQLYGDEIREVYARVEKSSQTHLAAPENFDASSSLDFVRSVVADIMTQTPGDDEDIFQHGCDSLQATWIRNSILHALKSSKQVAVRNIPDDFVYSNPSIRLLSEFLTGVASGSPSALLDVPRRASLMEEMVLKYSQEFPEHRPAVQVPHEQAVLVTGTTGALGSHILAHLLALPEISVVYAFNRVGSSIQERQRSSFVNNGIDAELLTSPKLRLLEGNLTKHAFGLAADDFSEIKTRVTCIIHNAWQVDWNLSLSSLEPFVEGTRDLVDFALTSPHAVPPRFVFVSTVGVFWNFDGETAPEARIPDATTSTGLGYAESKWVTEQMLEIASQKAGLDPVIVRAGQLSGGPGGAWKTSEWFPTLLRSSQLMGHLPEVQGGISWVPIHRAAQILVEMRTSRKRYLHLTHPHCVSFMDVVLPIAQEVQLPVVPYARWLESLETAASQGTNNPGVRLLDFFRANSVLLKAEAFFPAPLSNANAVEASRSMSSLAALGSRDAKEWVGYLRKVGYLA